jgi:hypothetical protein
VKEENNGCLRRSFGAGERGWMVFAGAISSIGTRPVRLMEGKKAQNNK